MNKQETIKGRRARNGLFGTALAILVIVTVLSAILLTVRLIDYIKVDDRAVSMRSSMDETLSVFAMQYKNETGEITVKGNDGEKVIAPGTEIEYTLRLRNTDKVALDYVFVPDVKFTSEHKLPILVRLLDPEDKYVIGNETTWVPIDQIGDIEENGTLMTNQTAEYVFQWKWPFESGDDAYDSMLGSVTINESVGIDLSFNLHSETNLSAESNGGAMNAPFSKVIRALIIFILLVAAIVLLIIYIVKRIKADNFKPIEIIKSVEIPVIQKVIEKVEEVVPVIQPTLHFSGKMAYVNIDTLDENFESGDTINIKILKEKNLIPLAAKQIKVLARSDKPLEKAFIVETQGISQKAEIAIRCAGGKVIIVAPNDGVKKK